jgi:prepilin signal peptidase PulO-like enzyme (type II secretory pathway)
MYWPIFWPCCSLFPIYSKIKTWINSLTNLLLTFSTVFGLLIGSFLNALIYRLPLGINIAIPRSSCPNCKHVICWYENIPVLSYLALRGKCSNCHTKISWQYPLIEIITGVFAYLIAPKSMEPSELFYFVFFLGVFSAFLVHFIVDLKHQILPDSINIYLGILFFVVSLITKPWTHWALGFALGLGFPLAVSWIFYLIKGQIGLGGGDIKLYGVLGLYLGPIAVMQNIFLSCFLGAIIGIILLSLKIIKRENPIPFGPFILIVASAQILTPNLFNQLLAYIP